MRQVLLIPEAMPVRAGSTTRKAAPAIVGFASPTPIPATMKPGSRTVQLESTDTSSMSAMPTATMARLAASSAPHRRPCCVPARNEWNQEDERRDRQEAEPSLQRRVAVDVLQVDRQERKEREHAGAQAEGRRLHADESRLLEERDIEHGPLLHPLDYDERDEQRDA